MARQRSILRSLVAGALIGVAETVPTTARLRRPLRPLRVVWIDDRDLPDPLDGLPVMILDPVRPSPWSDRRERGLGVTLATPLRILRRFRGHLHAD